MLGFNFRKSYSELENLIQLWEIQYFNARINLDKGSAHYCGLLGSITRFMLVGRDDGG